VNFTAEDDEDDEDYDYQSDYKRHYKAVKNIAIKNFID
jgi:hypothetical protein